MQLAAYIRMSTDKQEDSPETQRRIIQEYCNQNGHALIRTYQDLAKSGGSMDGRAALRELIRDAEKKVFDGVIIYKLDRAFRNLGEQVVTLKKLKNLGIKLLAAADPMSDGAAGDLIVNILGAVNQFERELTGERIFHHNRELAKQGKWTGGSRPPLGYGYNKKTKQIYTIPEEAATVKKVFEIFLKTQGSSTTAWELNRMGFKTKDGLSWTPQLVYNVLTNPFYTGKIRYGYRKQVQTENGKSYCKPGDKYELFPGQHEQIISDEDFEIVQEIFRRNSTYKKQSDRIYVFSGIFKCLICGGPVVGMYHHHINKKGYRCHWRVSRKDVCKGFTKLEYMIEDAVYKAITSNNEYLQQHKNVTVSSIDNSPSVDVSKQIKRLEQKLLRQQDMYEEGIYDKETFFVKRKATLEEIENLKKSAKGKNHSAQEEMIIGLMRKFNEIWAYRWDMPMEYRNLIHSLIREMYSDGKVLEIFFHPLELPGWQDKIKIQL